MSKPKSVTQATLQDGTHIKVETYGEGQPLLLPANPVPFDEPLAEQMRHYGADPALGQNLINGLSDMMQVVVFDYEGHVRRTPRADTLTPDNIVSDFLAVADAAGVDRFAYYGYSWLGMMGLQLALRSKRVSALAIGGFPPLEGPYEPMLRITTATYELAGVAVDDEWSVESLSKDETKQFMTLYQSLQNFDDRAAQSQLTCPRLCFVGSKDEILYDKTWGDVFLSLSGPIIRHQAELEALGWEVHILPELDHMKAMQVSQVIPMLRAWLPKVLDIK